MTKNPEAFIGQGEATENFEKTEVKDNSPNFSKENSLSVKEAAQMLSVSEWTIYQLIKGDPKFPAFNVGLKKKYVIRKSLFEEWITSRKKGSV